MASRHSLRSLKGPSKPNTTLVPASMMQTVRDEIAAINRGEGRKFSGNRYEINGRVYVQKNGGTFYPASGPGFIRPIDRGTHATLLILKERGGMTEDARFRIERGV